MKNNLKFTSMKKLLILLCTFLVGFSYAQSGDPKVDEMLQALQKAPGKIVFKMNGKTRNEIASFIEDGKRGLLISSHLTLDNTPEIFISLIAPTKKSGTYMIDYSKKAGVLQIKEKAYQIRGTIVLKVLGKKISGTFSGELFEILKNKSKPSETSSGKITGSFVN
jgi:hypothetical protein